ncbi:hypothetical protein EON64_09940 [archaeon]|nr:MAG: hypothetical protein EON64_09940 [archaeon]
MGALADMTAISVIIGQVLHAAPSTIIQCIPFNDYLTVAASVYFGVKNLMKASQIQTKEKSKIEIELE